MDADSLLTPTNAALVPTVLALTSGLKIAGGPFFQSGFGWRTLPLLPLFLGVLVSVVMLDGSWGQRLLNGFIVGASAMSLFQVTKRAAGKVSAPPKPKAERPMPPSLPSEDK